LVKKEDSTVETDFTEQLAINDEDKVLVDCVDGICAQTQGYIKNDGKMYVFIGEESGVIVKRSLVGGSSCSSNTIGKLINDKSAVCISSGKSIAFEEEEDDHMIMKGAAVEGTPFENVNEIKAVKHSANYVIIDKHLTTSMYY